MNDAPDFKPVRPEDVTDLALLPKRFDMFASEMRSAFEILGDKILPALDRVKDMLTDFGERVSQLEIDMARTDQRLAALEARTPKKRRTPHK